MVVYCEPIEDDATLTCAVELSPEVDVPVSVDIEWIGPDGSTANGMSQVITESPFFNTVMASTFGKQTGVYKCIASISSSLVLITKSDSASGSTTASLGMLII